MQASELFRSDAYQQNCDATIIAVDGNQVVLDQTVFYPTGGGQPGDHGELVRTSDGALFNVIDARKSETPGLVAHLLSEPADGLQAGDKVTAKIDWQRRHRLMRMHSCLHLLCRAVDGAVTGGSVGPEKSRLDFDIPEPNLDKETIAATINGWIAGDHPITSRWISAEELAGQPELVRTMSVRPPTSGGMVRLVEIKDVDLQACGGTHVRSTKEIGPVKVSKIEKKGRQNRRVSIVFDEG